MPQVECAICKKPITRTGPSKADASRHMLHYPCDHCADYLVDEAAKITVLDQLAGNSKARAILMHAVRRMADRNPGRLPELTADIIKNIVAHGSLPDPTQQVANLILWIGNQAAVGQWIRIMPRHQAVVGAMDSSGIGWVLGCLEDERLVEFQGDHQRNSSFATVRLTLAGWRRYRELQRGVLDSHMAFMAMPFNMERCDRVYERCFKPGVEATGFVLKRLDEDQPAGVIDDRLRVKIQTARFLVAELTDENRGAYWESGFAEGLGKPVIYTCEEGHIADVHFDTNHHLIVQWDEADLGKAEAKLKATIRATFPADAKLTDEPES